LAITITKNSHFGHKLRKISGNPGATGPPVDLDRLFETLLISHL